MVIRRTFHSLIILIMLLCPILLSALELKEGRVKLILHENNGRFTSYYLEDVRKNKYSAFFLDQDPRTTVLSILVDNKVYRMGESSGFSETVQKTAEGARFVWESSFIQVTEDFTFIKSVGAPLSDGIRITITVKNISERALSIGIRYLFDTYLGERDNIHFKTDSISSVKNEKAFTPTSMPAYIVSKSEKGDNPGFQIITSKTGITRIDKVILGNWKRLNDNSWTYDVNTTRNFNQLPYSINDSAVALYYNAERVEKGSSRSSIILCGAYSPEGFTTGNTAGDSEIAALFDQTVIDQGEGGSQDINISVQTDLIAVRDLIHKINSKLESNEDISDAELTVMEHVITELTMKKRSMKIKKGFRNGRECINKGIQTISSRQIQ